MGRRKIKMEKVQDTNTKQVTFSKRRLGLFKKASELATLCNAEVGIVVFSPGNKPYSFGKPNFDVIAERFKNEFEEEEEGDSCETSGYSRGNRARQEKKICKRLNSITEEAEAEKKHGEDLHKWLESAEQDKFNKPIEELTLEELKEFEAKIKKISCGIQSNISHMQASSSLMFLSNDN
ncbi:putative transcription factor MADS-type1 family [Arabidopsis thaliana]|uniref:AGAMOUS-like 91 n=4 Tax=Arabidopsis TaxID=3701 RepID=Q9C836_ARATH|nr:AGAMOUS-like 91 [Arabidopsis thaliana]KAG7624296.1 Transcription factor MADS-box [Arabidopsis thaliana x Arabidopsis arenosa]KAG7630307.1 Transcription factor MADS-box [Arabidopsis suecica]AAG50993.1 SRF-type transcription factor; 29224-29760 [Arabidopsis thaliana]AAY78782.1 MADS-box family protein [Arabidopsis thaliana]AEE74432.1 AGAMOUS-like 91 [Arabidopsis thaliana]|eukprot:NP_187320.1 AGAMOUS-like 91 [Arabidopsis thaliana]